MIKSDIAFTFMKKFNLRLITFHFLATIFIVLGARQFASLIDTDLVIALQTHTSNDFYRDLDGTLKDIINHLDVKGNLTLGERLYRFNYWIFTSVLIALCLSFTVSLIISIRKKIFWPNSVLVLMAGFLTYRFGLLNLYEIKKAVFAFGDLFISYGQQYTLFINGSLLTIIGLFLFLNKWTNKFILKQYNGQTDVGQ